MATAIVNSRPPSGRGPAPSVPSHAHHSLLPVPPRLPFPTSPALPDRRARLKRLNLSITSREGGVTETGSDGGSGLEEDILLSKRAAHMGHTPRGHNRTHARGRLGSASSAAATAGQHDRHHIAGFTDNGSERLQPQLNLRDPSSEDSGYMPPPSKLRHRNIITSRQHKALGDAPEEGVDPRARHRRNHSRQGRGEPIRFRLPDISIRQTVSSPQP
ncbi:hypothetical protein EGW08_013658, partial [Elysia chlorotica]